MASEDDLSSLSKKMDQMANALAQMDQSLRLMNHLLDHTNLRHPYLHQIGSMVVQLKDMDKVSKLMEHDMFPNPLVLIGRWLCWKKDLEPEVLLGNLQVEYKDCL